MGNKQSYLRELTEEEFDKFEVLKCGGMGGSGSCDDCVLDLIGFPCNRPELILDPAIRKLFRATPDNKVVLVLGILHQ